MVAQFSAQWAVPDPGVKASVDIIGTDVAYKEYIRIASVIKAGGRVAFGTDWPAANYTSTYKPLDAIQSAVTRAMLPQYAKSQFLPQMPPVNEVISLADALQASTLAAAYVLRLEDKIGSVEVGKLADLVVLEKNLFDVPNGEIAGTKILLTMFNGKVVFESPETNR